MRIISGVARGRKLKDVKINIRPTSDKVKESIFSIIQFDIEGRRVLDLFAGSGQLGIEALSRGASSVVFVDYDLKAVKLVKENLKLSGLFDFATVYQANAENFLSKNSAPDDTYDIIFFDPPYNSSLFNETLRTVFEFDKLNSNGIIICESEIDTPVPSINSPYVLSKGYRYGNTRILKIIKE